MGGDKYTKEHTHGGDRKIHTGEDIHIERHTYGGTHKWRNTQTEGHTNRKTHK